MPLGGSTWAHGPDEETQETLLPQGVQISHTQMPVRQAQPPEPTQQQQKLRREVPGPTTGDTE